MGSSPLLAFMETEGGQEQLVPLLTYEDVLCLALLAIECDLESLRHVLLNAKGSLPPIGTRMLMQYAAKRGWWSFVVLTSRQGRRWDRQHAPHRGLVELEDSDNEGLTRCQLFLRQFPVKFDADVMFAAAERGIMAEVVWLHLYTDYEAKEAIEKAANASNVAVLEWLLDHEDTARNRYDPSDREQCVVWLRQNESSIRATCWFDPNEYTIHCVLASAGRLPPMESHSRMYPIMDWAAKQGDLGLLKRLDGDPSGKNMCTAAAMVHAAENGDVAVMQWLSEHRSESLDSPIDLLSAAARQGHVAMMDWVHLRYTIPSHMLHTPFADALRGGHFGALRWFVSHFNNNLGQLDSYRTYATHGNNPEIVRYVCEELGYELSFVDMENVVWRGDFNVAQWMVSHHRDKVLPRPEYLAQVLLAAIKNGELERVQWCVEELGAWSPFAVELAARRGEIRLFRYLWTIAEETPRRQEQLVYTWTTESSLLTCIPHVDSVQWLLEHFDENASTVVSERDIQMLLASRAIRSPSLQRAFMQYRPRLCCHIPLLPLWILQTGTFADLEMLEAIQHPDLFTEKTLDYLLKSTRDDRIMKWFVSRCEPSVVDIRIANWCARYGVVEMLPLLLGMYPPRCDDSLLLQFFGAVVSSAVRFEQLSVLEWVKLQDYQHINRLWTSHLVRMTARRGCGRSLLWLFDMGKGEERSIGGVGQDRGQTWSSQVPQALTKG